MTLTDEIREELREGLKKGVKYEQIRAKYDRDKGPFYNALETIFADIGTEIEKFSMEREKVAGQVGGAKSNLERINSEIEARERRATELEDCVWTYLCLFFLRLARCCRKGSPHL
jgi:chromosome segregation ATPase